MPKKAKTNNPSEAEDAPSVDYAAYIKRLGTLPAVLEQEPNDRIQAAVDDVLSGEEKGFDDKLMVQLIASVKTQLTIHGSDNHKAAVPARVRSADPKRQAHYDGLDAEVERIVSENQPLADLLVSLGFGMRALKDKTTGDVVPFSLARLIEGINNKNHEANPYRPHSNNTEGQTEVEG